MVAIFTGQGSGAQRGSGAVLGAAGLLGSGTAGRSGQQVMLNAATGNLMVQQNDAMVVGRGTDIALARTYNSRADPDEQSGTPSWVMNRRRIDVSAATGASGGRVRLHDADGSVITYDWDGSAYVTAAGAGAYDRIVRVGSTWQRTDGDTRTVEEFGQAFGGRNLLTKVRDIAGNETLYAYDAQERIDRITSADGSWVQYGYDGNRPNASAVTISYRDLATNATRTERVAYGYDSLERLTSATVDLTPEDGSVADGRTYGTLYSYVGTTRHVATITETDGSFLEIGYDTQNRVTSLKERVVVGTVRTTTLSYGIGFTTITDASGQVTRLDYNSDGSLKSIRAPASDPGAAAQVTSFTYTARGDVASVTDALGKVTRFTFDANGNVLTHTDRLGDVVRRTYDANNRMLTETRFGSDAGSARRGQTTRFVYQSNGQLRFTVSADGRVSEQRYNSYGEIVATLRYTDQRYAAGTRAPTLAQMVAWVAALPDQTAVEQSVFAYDARGNLMSQTDYAASTAPGNPSTAEGYRQVSYLYDHAGRLLNRTQAGQNSEQFVYDGLGRMVASTDLNGAVTTIAFDDPATRTVVTLANGLVQTSTYTKSGELIAYAEAGEFVLGGSITYANDAMGRPRVRINQSGLESYMLYDRVGRKVADVGLTGEVTEYRYDAADRLVATVRYATRLSTTALAAVRDPAASPDLSAIRPAAAEGDLYTWQVYDAEGRVVERIDGTGSAISYAYDASGRLVSTVDYATRLTEAQLTTFRTAPPAAPVLPASTDSDRVARTFYDADGRLVGEMDGAGSLRTMTYDAAGNRVAETRYGSAVPEDRRATASLQDIVQLMGAHHRALVRRCGDQSEALPLAGGCCRLPHAGNLAAPLAHQAEDAAIAGDLPRQLLDQRGLADTAGGEDADPLPDAQRQQPVDGADTGRQRGRRIDPLQRGCSVARPLTADGNGAPAVDRPAERIDHAAREAVAGAATAIVRRHGDARAEAKLRLSVERYQGDAVAPHRHHLRDDLPRRGNGDGAERADRCGGAVGVDVVGGEGVDAAVRGRAVHARQRAKEWVGHHATSVARRSVASITDHCAAGSRSTAPMRRPIRHAPAGSPGARSTRQPTGTSACTAASSAKSCALTATLTIPSRSRRSRWCAIVRVTSCARSPLSPNRRASAAETRSTASRSVARSRSRHVARASAMPVCNRASRSASFATASAWPAARASATALRVSARDSASFVAADRRSSSIVRSSSAMRVSSARCRASSGGTAATGRRAAGRRPAATPARACLMRTLIAPSPA